MSNLKVLLLSFIVLFVFGFVLAQAQLSFAQENLGGQEAQEAVDVTEELNLDEDVEAEDLEVGYPRVLPDSPFYFLKNWGREIRTAFAFNPVAKAELRERFANEKLIELKKMVETKKGSATIKKAADNYQNEVRKIKQVAERIEEKAQESPRVDKFLDKYVKHQVLHQRLLQKLETQVPAEAFEKIKEAREIHIERFADVMTKLEDRKEKIGERLEKGMEEIKGSEFKEFKNLEVLKGLEEKVPEAAKESIQRVRQNSLIRLKTTVEQISPEKLERFKTYTERIAGEKEKQVEILENLKVELEAKPVIRQKLIESRDKVLEKIRTKAEERDCPEIEKPSPDFCKEGRVVVKKDEQSCIISFDCVVPAEAETPTIRPKEGQTACITLWDPVCGKNGKTYSNTCFAKAAGVEINYKGACKEMPVRERLQRILPKVKP